MRFLYLAMLILFFSTSLFSQIEIAPLTSNPVLKAHQLKLGKTRPDDFLLRLTTSNCPDPTQVDTTFEESSTVYVISGESVLICIDQLAFTILDTVACLNCDDLMFGSATYNPDNFCYTYAANSGIEAETGDVLQLVATDLNGDTELEFPVVVKRESQTITMPASTVFVESSIDLCIGDLNLPGTERDYCFKDCNNPLYSQLTAPDSCITYTAKRFAELDEVCIEVCDEFCVCDTYVFPISIEGPVLDLPFFDDFSNEGPFPDKNLWLDDNVYVNNHFPYRPISVGVATFDGLDQTGTPYGGVGAADYLTSAYIDLSGYDADDNIYLSYFLQAKGLSNFFPGTLDSLVLQFRTDTSGWETIVSHRGLLGSTSPLARIPFETDSIKTHHIRNIRFLHDRFQFRFINHCQRLGMQYLWNLDYVRLNSVEIPDGSFSDIAFTNVPNSVLKEYRHMPLSHFLASPNTEIRNEIDIEVYNNFPVEDEIDPNTVFVKDFNSSTTVVNSMELLSLPQRNVPPQEHQFHTNPVDLSSLIDDLNTENQYVLEMTYTMNPDAQQDEVLYPATGRNDTVRSRTVFADFFAYDDGSPESLIAGDKKGLQLAAEFHANIADSLVGVQFNFPHTGNNLNADFVIKVWLDEKDNDENPIYTSPDLSVIYPDLFFDTLNGFTTYRFQSEELENIKVPIPAGKFFVGIEQTSSGRIGIGFDVNSADAANFQLFKGASFNSEWDTIVQPGALMIRPMVGEEFPLFTAVEEPRMEPAELSLKLYPNPVQDRLYLPVNQEETGDLELQVISSTGQILLNQAWRAELEVNNWDNGLYFIQITNRKTGAQVKRKFLILR